MRIPVPEPLILLAVAPSLQGVYLVGPPAAAEPPLTALARLLTEGPAVRVPASIGPDQLDEQLDVQQTLAAGRPVYRPGLVERARGGALVMEAADLVPAPAAAFLASLLDELPSGQRPVILARSGTSPRPADAMASRCALWVDVTSIWDRVEPGATPWRLRQVVPHDTLAGHRVRMDGRLLRERVAAARARLAQVSLADELLQDICRRVGTGAVDQGLDYYVACAARARAAWHGRTEVLEADVGTALRWIVEPRRIAASGSGSRGSVQPPAAKPAPSVGDAAAAGLPPAARPSPGTAAEARAFAPAAWPASPAAPAAPSLSPPPPNAGKPDPARGASDSYGRREPGGQGDGAQDPPVVIVPPAALGGALSLPGAAVPRPSLTPRNQAGANRGGTRPSPRRFGTALAVVPTLLAAVPYQRLRTPLPPLAVRVLPEDLRWRRRRPQPRPLYILAVDGSGSMAQNRMHLAKAAAVQVLQGAYRERRRVALIDFRQRAARLVCPPGRSTALIRREIGALPSAGGTPLPAALAVSLRLAQAWRLRHPGNPVRLVLFTDGKANMPLADGKRPAPPAPGAVPAEGRARAWADVERLGALLRAEGVTCTLIDTAPPGTAEALHRLARCLGAGIIRIGFRRL